ncbi:protein FAR1-RELATED SEQUENCE 5-like [Silene latifolia]|uniref:protein FAR1-RELATED SEQUENCE 5-like n=1 Tax=Silene latifolia TaxID=37657 RepID=UPI003D7858FA
MTINDAAGISILNNYKSLVLEGGGHQNLSFKFSDSRNAINQERRRSLIDGDAEELKAYFEKMKEEDPNYFNAIELDDFGAPMNGFWCDSRCRAMCKAYSDAVTYDTTFLTNMYRMPFFPFIGVNQHGNSVVFACALVTRDYEESFEWVFAKFLERIGRAPSVILTDQERAIESYLIRESWVPAYWRGIFCAGMSSTQRSEKQNRFFKTYVNGRITLSQFAKKIEEALKLKVFHKLYTKKIYKLVRDEVIGLIYTNTDPPRRNGHSVTFNVQDKKAAPFGKCKNYWGHIHRSVGLLKCSCKLFEFKGILCRYIIRCMVIEDVKVIPEKLTSELIKELEGIAGVETIDAYVSGGVFSRVDKGFPLSEALLAHDKWLEEKGVRHTDFAVVTWSNWDCQVMLESECRFKKISKPSYFNR